MTLAQQRLGELAAWIASSSAARRTPLAGATAVGPWAVIVPADLDEPPQPTFDPEALPIFVAAEQTDGLNLPAIVTAAPDSQHRASARLAHLLWRIGEGTLPPAAVVELDDPAEAVGAALDRQGAGALDMAVWPVLTVPVWALSPADRATIAGKLPMLL